MEKLNENEAAGILIEKGILFKKKLPDIGMNYPDNEYYYSFSDEFKKGFLDHVFKVINKNISIHAKYHQSIILKRIKHFPEAVRKEKIISEIETIEGKIQPYSLDDDTKRSMVFDTYGYVDCLNFANRNFTNGILKGLLNDDVKDFIHDEALERVIYLLKKEYDVKDSSKPKQITYQWQGNPEKELPELYRLMINKQLIAPDTNLEQFKAIFTGQPVDDIEPVKWNVAKNLNAYFIEQLLKTTKINKNLNPNIWDIAKYCFVNGNNFSQIIDQYKNSKTGKPKNHTLIDDILNTL